MDMTCNCKSGYTCVACKVKRGDYKDWTTTAPRVRKPCSVPSCDRLEDTLGMCWKHYNNYRWRIRQGYDVKPPIPQRPYTPQAERNRL